MSIQEELARIESGIAIENGLARRESEIAKEVGDEESRHNQVLVDLQKVTKSLRIATRCLNEVRGLIHSGRVIVLSDVSWAVNEIELIMASPGH